MNALHELTKLDVALAIFAGVMVGAVAALALLLSRKFPGIKAVNFDTAKAWMESSWLAGLPSTNFKSFTTVVLYFLTFLAWAAAVLFEKPIDNAAFGMWLAFLAGLGGFALAQFNTQRKTDYGYVDRTKAGASVIVTPTATTAAGDTVTATTDGSSATASTAPAPAPSTPAAQ